MTKCKRNDLVSHRPHDFFIYRFHTVRRHCRCGIMLETPVVFALQVDLEVRFLLRDTGTNCGCELGSTSGSQQGL